ncbi:MAG: TrmB family transcriptional regulator [Thaumarchaeota archaeon]|nr:TrmB family transcriptional regulator [Nitrososphaerota archaeon]
MSSEEDLISALKYFGLEGDDAKIYLGLLRTGEVTVGSLSAKLDVDRGKTYRALNKLRNSGLITTTLSNPTICKAVDPQEALKNIIAKKQDEITTMEKLSKQLITNLEELRRPTPVTEVSSFSIIQGRSNIYSRIGKMITESSDVVYIVTTVEDIMRMYHTAIPEKIKECTKKGGQVRIITEISNKQSIQLVNRLGASEIRLGKLPSKGRIVGEKDKQIIMSGSMKGSMDLNDDADSIVHTNSIEIVNNILSLCSHLWKKSKPLEVMYQSV